RDARVRHRRRHDGDRRALDRGLRPVQAHARDQVVTLEGYLRSRGRKILAPFLTCGFPSPDEFPTLLRGVVDAGADMLEIGIPFTDPLMDGPVVQRASDEALRNEMRPPVVLRTIGQMDVGVPFVFMTYVNPVMAVGWDEFAAQASLAGAAGTIVPDLPPEEAE